MRFADFISQQNKILSLNDQANQDRELTQGNIEMILNIVQRLIILLSLKKF